ncbi:D-aspartate oxidase-like [Haliotis rufescens]|uniref:D-aspartate oxidase-like n=1 Tax=Haliotis rufescens TaxID=6454 RepID=UPI001EB00B60|nr:D-aspartate oxidase-like [Haliotis rufescens]XP_046364610.1 D-aspartate oxidase-like [Haliotis rufescens]XP_048253574.1 D-aspartate oxidase-like [Haliotis rufescens]
MARVAVIGAGVVGLSTAINIKDCMPGSRVDIVADKFNQDTTSVGAAAWIVPWAPGVDEALQRKWGRTSMDYFIKLAVSEDSADSGASIGMGIHYATGPQTPPFKHLMLSFDPMSKESAEKLNLGKFYCYTGTTVVVDMSTYLHWLMASFQARGGIVLQRKVTSFQEFEGQYDVVVNCAGLGAKALTGDEKLQPMRGQIMRVAAPWVKHYLHCSDSVHFLPNVENTAIGGIKSVGDSDTSVRLDTSEHIWESITKLWPPLKKAKILWEWTGLRPYRVPPRVEAEVIRYGDKSLKVVHNYGHGSYGISMSWGTAVHAAELVKEMCKPTSRL